MAIPGVMKRGSRLRSGSCSLICLARLCLVWLVVWDGLSFVHGISWGGHQAAKSQVTQRFSRRGGDVAKALAEDNPDPKTQLKLWTTRVKQAATAERLIEVLDEAVDGPIFDFILASAAYHKLATLKRYLQQSEWDSPVIARLTARLQDMVLQDQLGARQLANVLWSIATLSDRFRIPTQLLGALIKSLPVYSKGMNPQELSNCLWASAQLKELAPDVLEVVPAIVPEIPSKAKDMIPQHLSNCLWSTLHLKHDRPIVLDILPAILMELKIQNMNSQQVSNSIEAFILLQDSVPEVARMLPHGDSVESILRAGVARLKTLLPRMRGRDLVFTVPVMLWACAKVGVYDRELMDSATQRFKSGKMRSSLPAFGVGALSWSYEELDAQDDFEDFRKLLRAEVARREFSRADVESCRLGRLQWNGANGI